MISISQALSHIKESGDTFELTYVRANTTKNGPQGSIKIVKCRYGAPNPKTLGGASVANKTGRHPRKQSLHKLSGTLPLTALPGKNYITPLISHIIGLNGMAIKH